MGVQGLWSLIEAVGKPIPLESLENKILAVDVSIWLHQATKGFRDANGQPLPNAHLLGLFHRVCKLLFYRIKPVFVFDGGVPPLKKQTLAARRIRKEAASSRANKASDKLIASLVQSELLGRGSAKQSQVINRKQNREKDLFELPSSSQANLPEETEDGAITGTFLSDSESEFESEHQGGDDFNIHSVDVDSAEFRALPPSVQHDILSDLRETRKQNSWGKMHEMPKEATDFSSFQVQRLLRRQKVQERLEEVGKEVHAASRRRFEEENEGFLVETNRFASDSTKEYVLMKRLPRIDDSQPLAKKPKIEQVDATDDEIGQDEILRMIQSDAGLSSESSDDFEEVTDGMSSVDFESPAAKDGVVAVSVSLDDDLGDDIFADVFGKENGKTKQKEAVVAVSVKLDDVLDEKEDIFSDVFSKNEEIKVPAGNSQETGNYDSGHSAELKFKGVSKRVAIPVETPFGDADVEKADFKEEEKLLEEMELALQKKIQAVAAAKVSSAGKISEVLLTGEVAAQRKNPAASTAAPWKNNEVLLRDGSEDSVIVSSAGAERLPKLASVAVPTLVEEGGKSSIKNVPTAVSTEDELDNVSESVVGEMSEDTSEDEAEEVVANAFTKIRRLEDADIGLNDLTKDESVRKETVAVVEPTTGKWKIEERAEQQNIESVLTNVYTSEVVVEESKVVPEKGKIDSERKFDESLPSIAADKSEKQPLSPRASAVSLPPSPPRAVIESPLEASPKKTPQKMLEEALESKSFWRFSEEMKSARREEQQEGYETDSDEFEEVRDTVAATRLTEEEKDQVQAVLEKERREIMKEKGRQERLATTITDQMYSEAQDLLRLFGVPYIVAPMEAEAQCAFLDMHQLTQGTITDDSDIWLFGGKRVYKNFFNQTKYVEYFNKDDIEKVFRLGRDELVCLALLTGSDYTEGLESVGPVTALEILSEFPGHGLDSLKSFKAWLQTQRDRTANTENRIRKKLKGIKLTPGFPSEVVVMAYIQPEVDDSTERFTWGDPDEVALKNFGREKFGWTNEKVDELLGPTLSRWRSKQSQTRIDSFFSVTFDREVKMSKRVLEALNRGAAWEHDESDVYVPKDEARTMQPRKQRRKRGAAAAVSEEVSSEAAEQAVNVSISEGEVADETTSEHFIEEAAAATAAAGTPSGSQARTRKTKDPAPSLRKVEDPTSLRARLGKALLKSNPGFKARLLAEKARKQRPRPESRRELHNEEAEQGVAPPAATRSRRASTEVQRPNERTVHRRPPPAPVEQPSTSSYVPVVPPRPDRVPEPVPLQPEVIPQRQRELEDMEMRKKKAAELFKSKKC